MKESTSISPPFPYWSINCSAKYSAPRYSSWRRDVSRAAEFQGQMVCRDVIEIKLVGWVAGNRQGGNPLMRYVKHKRASPVETDVGRENRNKPGEEEGMTARNGGQVRMCELWHCSDTDALKQTEEV